MQVGSLPDKTCNNSIGERKKASVTDQGVKEAVLSGLGYFATGTALEILVYILEVEHSVDFNFISENPSTLRTGLSAMFGNAVEVVEARICQALGTKFRIGSVGRTLEEMLSTIRSSEIPTSAT